MSDREAIVQSTDRTTFLTGLTFAESFVGSGQGQEVMPISMRPGFEDTPISAERWYSITAPLNPKTGEPQGDDDLFSSDISPATLNTTFGRIPTDINLLVLYSENDEFVPPHVDKEALVGRWKDACKAQWSDKGGIVLGGTHAMKDVSEEVVADFLERIKGFLTAMANVEDPDVPEESVMQDAGVSDEQKVEEKRREGIERKDAEDALTVREAAERALGAGLRDLLTKSSITEAEAPTLQDSPTVTEVPEKQSSQKNDQAPAASAKSENDGSMKPSEVEEPAVKPTEVEEPPEQVDQQDSEPSTTGATANPAGTEVKEVKEARDKSEVELPLAQAPGNAS